MTRVVIALLVIAQLVPLQVSATRGGGGHIDLPMCNSKKIYILNIDDYTGAQPCIVEDAVVVNPTNGIVYSAPSEWPDQTSHKYGTHSAPWYLIEAIKTSQYVTKDIEEADIVYVNDYCLYISWLGTIHEKGREIIHTPGDKIIKAYTESIDNLNKSVADQGTSHFIGIVVLVESEIVKTPRWKRHDGRDYVFYDPHPGFAAGKAAGQWRDFICMMFKNSMHIVVERAQRNICPTYWEIQDKMLLTPYVPNFPNTSLQYDAWENLLKPLKERTTFLYSKARCTPYSVEADQTVSNVGKKMRHDFAKALSYTAEDVKVQCTDEEFGMKHENFDEMLASMQNSKFCLVLPGDAASVRRLSETFMAGCLPVFVGPPYATMPLPADVDYRTVGLYFNISSYHSWLSQDFEWAIHPSVRPVDPQDAQYWIPDADITSQLIDVQSVDEIVPYLRNISEAKLDEMFDMMESQRHMFVFHHQLTKRWSAVNAIISRMCDRIDTPHTSIKIHVRTKATASSATKILDLGRIHRAEKSSKAHRAHLDHDSDYSMDDDDWWPLRRKLDR